MALSDVGLISPASPPFPAYTSDEFRAQVVKVTLCGREHRSGWAGGKERSHPESDFSSLERTFCPSLGEKRVEKKKKGQTEGRKREKRERKGEKEWLYSVLSPAAITVWVHH